MNEMCVYPKYQGQGMGSKIIESLEGELLIISVYMSMSDMEWW